MRTTHDQAPLDTQLESLTKQLCFPVNRTDGFQTDTRSFIASQTVVYIVINDLRSYVHCAHITKRCTDLASGAIQIGEAPGDHSACNPSEAHREVHPRKASSRVTCPMAIEVSERGAGF
jgi:hypothetical protein